MISILKDDNSQGKVKFISKQALFCSRRVFSGPFAKVIGWEYGSGNLLQREHPISRNQPINCSP